MARSPRKTAAPEENSAQSRSALPNIRAVAAHANVSIATVSRVLNGLDAHANQATRERVKEAAIALGYKPAHAGRILRLQQTKLVALLMPDISNAFYAAIARSIEIALRARDYTMILCNTDEDPKLQDFYLQEMRAYRVRGIALLGAVESPGLSFALDKGLPIIFVNRRPPDKGTFVGIDNYAAGKAVAEHFLVQGFSSYAVIHGPLHSSASRERYEGFSNRLQEAGRSLSKSNIVDGGLSAESGYKAARLLVGEQSYPRAVFCANDLVAYGLFRFCRERSLRVPEDIAIFGFDDNPMNEWILPWLSTIRIPYDAFGNAVTQALFNMWDGVGVKDVERVLPFTVELRGSAE